MSKPFKERKLGKFIWGVGDALKGKGIAGRALDAVFEIIPFINPVRIARDNAKQNGLKKLADNPEIQALAKNAGVELRDLIDDGPNWLQPTLAIIIVVGFLILIGIGAIDGVFFAELIKTLLGT